MHISKNRPVVAVPGNNYEVWIFFLSTIELYLLPASTQLCMYVWGNIPLRTRFNIPTAPAHARGEYTYIDANNQRRQHRDKEQTLKAPLFHPAATRRQQARPRPPRNKPLARLARETNQISTDPTKSNRDVPTAKSYETRL